MRRLALGLAVLVLLAGCRSAFRVTPTPETSMKGWELYSWEEQGSWHFALLPGTNRLKTDREILKSKEAVGGVKALEGRLGRLAKGQEIFWGKCDAAPFSCPPQDTIAQIEQICAEKGLTLHLTAQQ